VVCRLGRPFEGVPQRTCGLQRESGPGIADGEQPLLRRFAGACRRPAHDDATPLRGLERVQQEVLNDPLQLDRITLHAQRARPFPLEEEVARRRRRTQRLAALAQVLGGVEGLDPQRILPGFQARELDQIGEQRRHGADALLQHALEMIARGAGDLRLGEERGRARQHADAAPQVVRRLPQQRRALVLERLQGVQRGLEVAHPARRLRLLLAHVAAGALARPLHAQIDERQARDRHDLGLHARMLEGIGVERAQDHGLEVAPFAHRLADVVSLLPAMQAVLGRIALLLALGLRGRAHSHGAQLAGEIIDDARNVIIERAGGKPRAGRELRIVADRIAPLLQQRLPPLHEPGREGIQLLLNGRCRGGSGECLAGMAQ
jgi:hypothetical protein